MDLEPAVAGWVESVLPGRRVRATRTLTGGYSNHNVAVTMNDDTTYVLRRYRRSTRCAVEAALAVRLAGVVPVAEVVTADPHGVAVGEPLMLSVFVPGRSASEALAMVTGPERAELGSEIGATLARIGSVSFPVPGFFADGRLAPDGVEPTESLDVFVDRCLLTGNAAGHLDDAEQQALRRYAEQAAGELAAVRGGRRLVHADYNPKNLLVRERGGRWRVAAVLDWEFAFSSTPLVDIGNMLRFPRPDDYADAFVDGFRSAGGDLPPDWRRLSQALDLFSLADLLTRPVEHRYFGRAVQSVRALLRG